MDSMLAGAGRNESLQRAFDLLDAIGRAPAGTKTGELVAATGLPRSTVNRILASLYDVGAVVRPSSREWSLGPTITRLANSASPSLRLLSNSKEILADVTRELGETSMLGLTVGPTSVRIVDEVEGPRLVSVRSRWSGSTVDSPSSGFVRTLLAELPADRLKTVLSKMTITKHTEHTKTGLAELTDAIATIRRNDFSSVVNEVEDGLSGVGVPIRQDGRVVAQIAVYLPTSRLTSQMRERTLATLRGAATRFLPE